VRQLTTYSAQAAQTLVRCYSSVHSRPFHLLVLYALPSRCLLTASQAIQDEFGPQWVKDRHVRRLVKMGFREKAARVALAAAGDRLEPALDHLQVCGSAARLDCLLSLQGGHKSRQEVRV
jgi:hypothetical protein